MSIGKNKLTHDERRKLIMEKAAAVFAQYGLNGARTKEIAEACEVNEALIYKHFSSKEELFRESYMWYQLKLIKRLDSVLKDAANGYESLVRAMEFQVENTISDRIYSGFLLQSFASATQSDEIRDWVKAWHRGQNDYIDMILDKGIKDGSIRPDIDIEKIRWKIQSAGLAGIISGLVELDGERVRSLVEVIFRDILESITTEK